MSVIPLFGRSIRLVVFDWDGTVVDSVAGIVTAIQSAASELGLPVPDDVQARQVIGLSLNEAMQAVMPGLPASRRDEFVARYRQRYLLQPSGDVPFKGIPELLRTLVAGGVPLAVATGKSRRGLDRALVDTGLKSLFTATRCGEEGRSKPHPWMLASLSDALSVPAEAILMIGDTSHDIEMAHAFGAASIGVTYGAHESALVTAARPDAVVASVAALAKLLTPGDGAGAGSGSAAGG